MIFVSAHALSCDVSNIVDDDEGPDESAPIQFTNHQHLVLNMLKT